MKKDGIEDPVFFDYRENPAGRSAEFLSVFLKNIRAVGVMNSTDLPQQSQNAGNILRFCKTNFHNDTS